MTDPIETIDIGTTHDAAETHRLQLHHNASWTGEAQVIEIVLGPDGPMTRHWHVPVVRLYAGYLTAERPKYTDGTLVPLNVVARVVSVAATAHAHSLIAIAIRDGLLAAQKMLAP